MKQYDWLLCVAKTCDWSKKITHATVKLDFSVATSGASTYNESRIELQNIQIKNEMSSQLLSSEQPCEPKSLDVALNIVGLIEKYAEKTCGAVGGHLIRVLNEMSVSKKKVMWLVILKSISYRIA